LSTSSLFQIFLELINIFLELFYIFDLNLFCDRHLNFFALPSGVRWARTLGMQREIEAAKGGRVPANLVPRKADRFRSPFICLRKCCTLHVGLES
jgi:hypothetical protein